MRKGFSLVEVITVLAVLFVISIPLARLSVLTMYDIPKSQKLIESNTSILDALKYVKRDVNSAKSFPQSFQKYSASENRLLIEQQNKTICYTAEQGKISRIVVDEEGEKITWQIPDGKIEWQVWRKDGIGYAVEINKYVELKSYNRVDKKMSNSYVYFAGACQEAVN
jgi:prepilin-type N-terminal cleavage/methylation domain-containing protein